MTEQTLTLICRTPNQRLDKFLAESIPGVSRNRAKQLIDQGHVSAAGLVLKASTQLPAQTAVTVTLPQQKSENTDSLVPQPVPFDILFEDESILVINKPAGLVIHPAAGHRQDTLVNGLIHHCPEIIALHPERPGIVHRLDKDTSGVLVVAKTAQSLTDLQRQFKSRTVKKTYLALVHGHPAAEKGTIDVPLGRHPQDRQKFAPLKTGKPAKTHYRVRQALQNFSLLEVDLETGRTHQIRVHLAWLGHPVAGDAVYGKRKSRLALNRQFLHAHTLSFDHPKSKTRLTFSAPLPPELQAVLDQLV